MIETMEERGKLTIRLAGRIDSTNAPDAEKELMEIAAEHPGDEWIIAADDLEYISSAGLRVLMKLRKQAKKAVVIRNVAPSVYDILEMTGFTELFTVEKQLRQISVEGLPMIGKGANGEVYRLDEERIIKVYNPLTNTPDKIRREKNAARQAFIHGIPSAISYDIVKVGDRYGIIYEMIDAMTLGEAMARRPERLEEYAHRMAELLKTLHGTAFEPGVLPDARDGLQVWADVAEQSGCYSADVIAKLRSLIRSIPPRDTFIHGDFHPGNIMVSGDEFILIDMGDASVGDPIIDLLGAYQIMKLVPQRKGGSERYTGVPGEQMTRVWDIFIRDYTGMTESEMLAAYENRLKFYSLIRTLAGITFSELIPKEALGGLVKEVTNAFLTGYSIMQGNPG